MTQTVLIGDDDVNYDYDISKNEECKVITTQIGKYKDVNFVEMRRTCTCNSIPCIWVGCHGY